MKLYGLLIAKNESDIIEQTLLSIKKYGGFDGIFFYDNGSTDSTYQIVSKFGDLIKHSGIVTASYSDQLKYDLLYKHSDAYKDGDWLAILDADELYAEDLAPIIDLAEYSGSNYIETRSAQFYMTERDNAEQFNPQCAAIDQRPYYLINYGEPRFYKYSKHFKLNDTMVKSRHASMVQCKEKLLVNHFQYRSIHQLQTRIEVRRENNKSSGNWGHVNKDKWDDYLVQSSTLHEFNGTFTFGLPSRINLYKTRTSTAYTAGTLRWLAQNGYLNDDQLTFLDAGKLKKLMHRFIL